MKIGGWTRLGIALSCLWLVLASYLAYSELSTIYAHKKYEVAKEGVGSATFVFSAAQSDGEIQAELKDKVIPVFEADPEKYRDREVREPYEKYLAEHESSAFKSAVAFALLPIVALFALGWSVAWVRSGFRERRNA